MKSHYGEIGSLTSPGKSTRYSRGLTLLLWFTMLWGSDARLSSSSHTSSVQNLLGPGSRILQVSAECIAQASQLNCIPNNVGDGICQASCNIEVCNFDGGDCTNDSSDNLDQIQQLSQAFFYIFIGMFALLIGCCCFRVCFVGDPDTGEGSLFTRMITCLNPRKHSHSSDDSGTTSARRVQEAQTITVAREVQQSSGLTHGVDGLDELDENEVDLSMPLAQKLSMTSSKLPTAGEIDADDLESNFSRD